MANRHPGADVRRCCGVLGGSEMEEVMTLTDQIKAILATLLRCISLLKRAMMPKRADLAAASETDGMPYCIVRTYSAGVFAGLLQSREGKEAVVLNARRLWQWAGAASLSELGTRGTSAPESCKFPAPAVKVELTEVIEVLHCTESGRESIEEAPVWTK